MSENRILVRILSVLMILIMTVNEGVMYASAATELTAGTSGQETTLEDVQLFGDDTVVEFAPGVEESLTQTMGELEKLMDAGQVAYSEETGMLTLLDPHADLSGLDMDSVTPMMNGEVLDLDSDQAPVFAYEGTSGAALLTEADFAAAMVGETGEEADEEPEEEPDEEVFLQEEAPQLSETDEDVDAELMGLFDNCDHLKTNAKNVSYFSKAEKNPKAVGKIAAKGTVVLYKDKKTVGLFGDTYYKVKIPDVGTYWVLSKNLTDHDCSGSTPKTTTSRSAIPGNNSKHQKITYTPAKKCSTCGCTMKKKDEDVSKEKHDWNDLGICSQCGYDFKEDLKTVDNVRYMVTSDSAVVHKTPYGAGTKTRTLKKGDCVTVVAKAKNAMDNWWYKTDQGDWIWSDHVEKHTKHDYSKSTGLCACGKMFAYDIKAQDLKPYELAVDHDAPIREHPYSKSTKIETLTAEEVIYINGYTYSDPDPGWFSKGDKWYRLENKGGWIKETDVKEHTNHVYGPTSIGNCTMSGCRYQVKLQSEWLGSDKKAVAYETKSAGVVARELPYTGAAAKKTYGGKNTLVQLEKKVTNIHKEIWYQTTDKTWIKASDVKKHSHTYKVGVCTATGCGKVANSTTQNMNPFVIELLVQAPVKAKPFADAANSKTLPKGSCVSVNGITTVTEPAGIWYRTSDGGYISILSAKKHGHNFQEGYCAVCGTYEKWTSTDISAQVVRVKADNTVLREKPYAVAPKVRTLSKNSELLIVKQGKNSLKSIWYQTVDGYWIYSGNVKSMAGTKVVTSTNLALTDYKLTFVDDSGNGLHGVSVSWMEQTYTSDENGVVLLPFVAQKTKIVATKDKYDKVELTDYTMKSSHKETIVMALTGSYKATKVMLEYLDEEIDVLRTSKTMNQQHSQGFFDDATLVFTVQTSPSVKVGKFEIVQNKKVIATSTSGTFNPLTPHSFVPNKTIYLRVYDKNGTKRSEQELLIDIFNIGQMGESPVGKLGLGELGLTIPSGVPIIGGVEINLDPPSVIDFQVEIDDESIKGTLDFDIDAGKKLLKGAEPKKDADKNYWTDIGAYKKYWDTIMEMKNDGWTSYFNRKNIKDVMDGGGVDWDFNVGGYLQKFHGKDEWKGKIYFSVKASVGTEKQLTGPPVPLVFEVELSGKATSGVQWVTSAKVTNITVPLDFTVAVEISLGVGIKYIGSVSIYGKASLDMEFQIIPADWDKTNISLKGNVGIKVKALGAEILNVSLLESKVIYIVQDGYVEVFEAEDEYALLMDADRYTPIARDYLEDRSGWYDSGWGLMEDVTVSISDLNVKVLQSSTYTDLKPQVVTAVGAQQADGSRAQDTIMMLFTDDNAERADLDRTMLVYSLYDPNQGLWTEPQPVFDDGTADYGFSAHAVEDEIYLVWQNASSTQKEGASITEISKNLELTVAKYDAARDEFSCIQTVTDNDVYENMPRISAVDGQVVVSWFTNSDDDIFQNSGTNTVWYAVMDEEEYDTTEPYVAPDSGDLGEADRGDAEEYLPTNDGEETDEPVQQSEVMPAWTIRPMTPIPEKITSMAVGYMLDWTTKLDNGYVAYTTDEDGKTTTEEDQEIWLIDASAEAQEAVFYTNKASNVEFTKVHGSYAMTWYNQGQIYYALTPSAEIAPQLLFKDEVDLGGDYQLISNPDGEDMALLFTRSQEDCSNAYLMLYDYETFEWGLPVAVTDQELYINDFNGAYSEGSIISIFNRTAVNNTTFTESNSLCSAVINQREDLIIGGVDVNTFQLEPNTETSVLLTVTNGGTQRIPNFTVAMYDDNDVLISEQTVETPLRMGESTVVDLDLMMGDTIELATYRLEVHRKQEDGSIVEDVFPSNNVHFFTVGQPHLLLEAQSEPSEDENIVSLTVSNAGYGEQGGQLVLLDESGEVAEILVEQFAPLDHNSRYSCAVVLSDYHFDGETSKVFSFGVIAEGESAVCSEASIFVDQVGAAETVDFLVEDSDLTGPEGEDLALMDAEERYVTATIRNDTVNDLENVVLTVAAYDFRGIYLDTYSETISLLSEESYKFTATFLTEWDIYDVRIMLLDPETMEPLVEAGSLMLEYDIVPE